MTIGTSLYRPLSVRPGNLAFSSWSTSGAAGLQIGPLEGRWWAEGAPEGILLAPRDTWRWRLRIAVPDDVVEADVAAVVRAAVAKKGGKLEGSEEARRVALERVPATRAGRILHVGPYATEPESFGAAGDVWGGP